MSKSKVENYYKLLGTRSNISQSNIKKKYIEMVKKFPPETHPEEFQRIREAYEILRDPKKRREYDLMCKYGNKIEKLMEKAEWYALREDWEQARFMYQQAVDIMPDNLPAHLGLARAELSQGDFDMFDEHFEGILSLAPEGLEVPLYMARAVMYVEADYPEKAKAIFSNACEQFPERIHEAAQSLISAFVDCDMDEEAWEMLVSILPESGQEKTEHVHLFIVWVYTMARLNKWNLWSQVQSRIRKFLKSITNEADKQFVLTAFDEQVEMMYEVGAFRLSEIFINFMHGIAPKNPAIKEKRSKIQQVMLLEKELNRMARDFEMFPLVFHEAQRYFVELFVPTDDVADIEEEIPFDLLEELQDMDVEFLAGINRVKKKYPLIYRQFKNNWEQLYEEHAKDVSREVRRKFS